MKTAQPHTSRKRIGHKTLFTTLTLATLILAAIPLRTNAAACPPGITGNCPVQSNILAWEYGEDIIFDGPAGASGFIQAITQSPGVTYLKVKNNCTPTPQNPAKPLFFGKPIAAGLEFQTAFSAIQGLCGLNGTIFIPESRVSINRTECIAIDCLPDQPNPNQTQHTTTINWTRQETFHCPIVNIPGWATVLNAHPDTGATTHCTGSNSSHVIWTSGSNTLTSGPNNCPPTNAPSCGGQPTPPCQNPPCCVPSSTSEGAPYRDTNGDCVADVTCTDGTPGDGSCNVTCPQSSWTIAATGCPPAKSAATWSPDPVTWQCSGTTATCPDQRCTPGNPDPNDPLYTAWECPNPPTRPGTCSGVKPTCNCNITPPTWSSPTWDNTCPTPLCEKTCTSDGSPDPANPSCTGWECPSPATKSVPTYQCTSGTKPTCLQCSSRQWRNDGAAAWTGRNSQGVASACTQNQLCTDGVDDGTPSCTNWECPNTSRTRTVGDSNCTACVPKTISSSNTFSCSGGKCMKTVKTTCTNGTQGKGNCDWQCSASDSGTSSPVQAPISSCSGGCSCDTAVWTQKFSAKWNGNQCQDEETCSIGSNPCAGQSCSNAVRNKSVAASNCPCVPKRVTTVSGSCAWTAWKETGTPSWNTANKCTINETRDRECTRKCKAGKAGNRACATPPPTGVTCGASDTGKYTQRTATRSKVIADSRCSACVSEAPCTPAGSPCQSCSYITRQLVSGVCQDTPVTVSCPPSAVCVPKTLNASVTTNWKNTYNHDPQDQNICLEDGEEVVTHTCTDGTDGTPTPCDWECDSQWPDNGTQTTKVTREEPDMSNCPQSPETGCCIVP